MVNTLRMYSGRMDRSNRLARRQTRRRKRQMLSGCEFWMERLNRGFFLRRNVDASASFGSPSLRLGKTEMEYVVCFD